MSQIEAGIPVTVTATGLVSTGRGRVIGALCTASTSMTLQLWDNTSAAGTKICDTVTLAAGTFYRLPSLYNNGLFATVGGTGSFTLYFQPEN